MKKRGLSSDEDALWRRTTRDVKKLPSGPQRIADGISFSTVTSRGGSPLQTTARRAYIPDAPTKETGKKKGPTLDGSVVGAGDPGFDKRVSRRRMPIDRTLDLHGLTQAAAQVSLRAFLETARRDQCRCVLVVTGKGGGPTTRGVLHSQFSHWVNDDALRLLIARVAPAHQKDGGAGAWYVFLKQRRSF